MQNGIFLTGTIFGPEPMFVNKANFLTHVFMYKMGVGCIVFVSFLFGSCIVGELLVGLGFFVIIAFELLLINYQNRYRVRSRARLLKLNLFLALLNIFSFFLEIWINYFIRRKSETRLMKLIRTSTTHPWSTVYQVLKIMEGQCFLKTQLIQVSFLYSKTIGNKHCFKN